MSRVLKAAVAFVVVGSAFVSAARGQNATDAPDAPTPSVSPATAREAVVPPPIRPWIAPEGSLVVTLPSDQTLPKGILQFLVTHRFRSPVRGSNAHSLYSLDSGADFGVGFAYSPFSRTEISLYRSAIQDDYEL